MKLLILYYGFILFYVFQAAGQLITGYRYNPVSPWGNIIFNTCIAALGLYAYRKNRSERWVAATSVYLLPLAMLGLAANFYSQPMVILSFYTAFTSKGNKIVRRVINFICITICLLPMLMLAALAIISPMGVMLGLGGRTTVKEIYSSDKQYVAVVEIVEAVPAGGSADVSAGKYLDLGILGKYLPNRSLYYENRTDYPRIEFSEADGGIFINGVYHEMQ